MSTKVANGASPEAVVRTMVLPEIREMTARVKIEGLSPLICHNFDEKARKQILEKQMKKAKAPKVAKDPEALFRASLYVIPGMEDEPDGTAGKYYFPARAFKACAIEACRFLDLKMTQARGLFFVKAEPTLTFDELVMREDRVTISISTTDLRYRGMFNGWSTDLDIEYNAAVCELEQIVNLLHFGGFHVGVGEWRPGSKSGGEFGRFRVVSVEG